MKISRSRINLNNINKLNLLIGDMGIASCDDPSWSIERDPPKTSRLYFVLEGDAYIETKDCKYRLEPGKCYLIPSGFSFRTRLESHMKLIYFYLRIIDSNGFDLLEKCGRVLAYTPDPSVAETVSSAIRTDFLSASLRIRCEVLDAVLAILKENCIELEDTVHSPEVLAAIEYINSTLSIQLDVDEIAARSHVSVSTLTKKFKNEVGLTVSAYIDRAIMLEAAFLLQYTDMTVQQISERFGFCYQSYFSRRFKENFNETPKAYRNRKRGL